jgi:selenophosphate synthase
VGAETSRVKLTDLAACGGCAAKYSAARLEELLRGFLPVEEENLLVGLAPADDAAVSTTSARSSSRSTSSRPSSTTPATTVRSPRRTR